MTITPDGNPTSAEALYAEGLAAFRRGDTDESRRLNEESARVARDAGDSRGVGKALIGLARVALRDREFDRVHALAAKSRDIAVQLEDRDGLRLPLHLDAEATRMRGDLSRARELYEESIALNRELGNRHMVGVECGNLAWVEISAGNVDVAATLLAESLAIAGEDEDVYGHAFGLIGFARLAVDEAEADTAARLLGAAEALLERDAMVLDPADAPEYERTVVLARNHLGLDAFEECRKAGRDLGVADAIALFNSRGRSR